MRHAVQRMIPRVVLEHGYSPAGVIAGEVRDMLFELIPETFDVRTLGVGGRWDHLTNSFLISAKVSTE